MSLKDKESIIKILKVLKEIDNIEVIKCALDSLIDKLEEQDSEERTK